MGIFMSLLVEAGPKLVIAVHSPCTLLPNPFPISASNPFLFPAKANSPIQTLTFIAPESTSFLPSHHITNPTLFFSTIDFSPEFSFTHMLEFSKLAAAFAIELGEWEKA